MVELIPDAAWVSNSQTYILLMQYSRLKMKEIKCYVNLTY